MELNLQISRELGLSVFAAFVVAAFVGYRLLTRRIRRRRVVALELRLESAWEQFRVSWGIPGSHKSVAMTSALVGGLQTGPQGRLLSMRPLSPFPARKPEPARVPLASAATAVAQSAPSAPAPIETVQQTQISCDI
jgi:hypothetical protein